MSDVMLVLMWDVMLVLGSGRTLDKKLGIRLVLHLGKQLGENLDKMLV